ncbi:translation machinery-associated protein 16 [Sporothrix schenckii 1099-18]|uniref:Translation machinery-associated protein 16 n=1 Tax=Sporothrix schenckii 1099-18 TaxID=1397361 RepID=A0A0F2MCJ3_SPOSC|nr:translation machinery-associated protein 16 [Sporothrix schenckii 1099-18]KJR87423.1 translation machinery-associated protein 16 [Sporothrix schenckii 1099-18]
MQRTLDKTRKQIVKKKGPLGTVHEGSRDSRRLRKALARDGRLGKLATSRKMHEQSFVDRAGFFQDSVRETGIDVFDADQFMAVVKSFVHQYDEEMDALKRTRRPGRPASTREDALKVKMTALEKEFQNGFLAPDLTSKDNVSALERWDGSWLQLNSLSWVRINEAGAVRPATFPPNKD